MLYVQSNAINFTQLNGKLTRMIIFVIILSLPLSSSKGTCCNIFAVSSETLGTRQNQPKKLTTFIKDTEVHGKPSYNSIDKSKILYYKASDKKWRVSQSKKRDNAGIRSEIDTNVTCPGDAKVWQYFNIKKRTWINDPNLTFTCNQTLSSTTTTTTITPTTTINAPISIGPKLVIGLGIGGSVGALVLGIIVAFCIRRELKSRAPSVKNDVNPVYGDYGEVYEETEIYDTNAYYGAGDMEETGATLIRDNNPEYE